MLIDEDLRAGTLIQLLEEFPVATYWVKMLVPRIKMSRPAVSALVNFLKDSMQSTDQAKV
jgi:DNA-binding transcriptional LysR family regulator